MSQPIYQLALLHHRKNESFTPRLLRLKILMPSVSTESNSMPASCT